MAARFYKHFPSGLEMSRRHFLKHVSAGAAWAGSATHFFTTLQAEAAELKKKSKVRDSVMDGGWAIHD